MWFYGSNYLAVSQITVELDINMDVRMSNLRDLRESFLKFHIVHSYLTADILPIMKSNVLLYVLLTKHEWVVAVFVYNLMKKLIAKRFGYSIKCLRCNISKSRHYGCGVIAMHRRQYHVLKGNKRRP